MSKLIDIYKDLFDEPDIAHVICKYIAYSNAGITYNFGNTMLSKGTKLYRIRKYKDDIDFSNSKEWDPSPKKQQNRCNNNGEMALYLGSNKEICLLETHIKQNEKYVLGEYEVISDIKLGGFLYSNKNDSEWKILAGNLFNAFLMAPNRTDESKELFELIDSLCTDIDFSTIRLKHINNPKELFMIPLRIAHINKKDQYYNMTNRMCNILKRQNPKGIRYSSCYLPVEITGIETNAYNICLYEEALKDIRWVNSKVIINTSNINAKDILKILIDNFLK